MVEIDPREGSGVIPNDWEAFPQPKDHAGAVVRGVNSPRVRDKEGRVSWPIPPSIRSKVSVPAS
jgi:hypothetical protein